MLTDLSEDEKSKLKSDILAAVEAATNTEIDADSVVLAQLPNSSDNLDVGSNVTAAITLDSPGVTATLILTLTFVRNDAAVERAKNSLDAQIAAQNVKIAVRGKDVAVEQPSVKTNGVKVFVDPSRAKQNALTLVPADADDDDAAAESVATTAAPDPDSSIPNKTIVVAIVLLMVGLLALAVGCGIILSRRHRNRDGGDNANAWARKSPHVVQNQAYVHPDTARQQSHGIQNAQDTIGGGGPSAGDARYEAPVASQPQVYDDSKAYEAPVVSQPQVYDESKMNNQGAGSGEIDGGYYAFSGNTFGRLGDDATYGGIIGTFADDSTVGASAEGGNVEDETSKPGATESKSFQASATGSQRKASVYKGFDASEQKSFQASSKGPQRKGSVYKGFEVQEMDC